MSSNSAAEEQTRHKKRKTSSSSSSSSSSPLSSLPDELALSCLARVSRSGQTALSGVCKTYRSLVTSPELYKTRSLLRCTENCIYVCLLSPPPDPSPRWFTLLRRPDGNRFLSPIRWDHCQAPEGSSVVTLDSGIYVIGGLIKGKPTSDVLFLDCRTNRWRWRPIPPMRTARSSPAAGVIDGKIYVFGGPEDRHSSNLEEVFDPKTQTWDSLIPMPDPEQWCLYIQDSLVVREEKVYAVDIKERSFYYSPSEGRWGKGNRAQAIGVRGGKCLIDKFIYCIDHYGRLCWCELEQLERKPKYEEEAMYWRKVQGLETLEKSLYDSRLVHFDDEEEGIWHGGTNLYPGARLSNSGPNILLFWDVVVQDRLEIWCAEISMERRCQGAEIWGNIVWSNAVMTVDPFLHHYKQQPCDGFFAIKCEALVAIQIDSKIRHVYIPSLVSPIPCAFIRIFQESCGDVGALVEKGVEFETVHVDLMKGEKR